MPTVKAVKRASTSTRIRRSLEKIPVLGIFLAVAFSFLENQLRNVIRRKNGYKLAVFFKYQFFVSVFGAGMFMYIGICQLSFVSGDMSSASSCDVGTTIEVEGSSEDLFSNNVPVESVFLAAAEYHRSAIQCSGDLLQDYSSAICSTAEARALGILIMIVACMYIFVAILCMFLWTGYSFFSNLPSDSLNIEVPDCRITCLGAVTKQGPRAMRIANIFAFILMLVLIILTNGVNYCKGDFGLTHNCISFYDDCALNQIKNCQYYFSSNCAGSDLPFSASQSFGDIVPYCLKPDLFKRFSGRYDARVLHTDTCSRCWVLHHDCLDIDISHMRTVEGTTYGIVTGDTPYYGSSSGTAIQQEMLRKVACTCTNANIGTGFDTDCTSLTYEDQTCSYSSSSADSSLTSYASTPSTDLKSDKVAYRSDAAFGITSPTWCTSWLSSANYESYGSYTFEYNECYSQTGSYVNRTSFLIAFVMLYLSALIIGTGALLRQNVQIDTWAYYPPEANENACWTIVRATGPG